jgi:hypothetical protein
MKVNELIKILSDFHPRNEVQISHWTGEQEIVSEIPQVVVGNGDYPGDDDVRVVLFTESKTQRVKQEKKSNKYTENNPYGKTMFLEKRR